MPEQREHVQASACPDAESLAAYIDGRLGGAAREEIETHMAWCPSCYETFVETVRLQGEIPSGARVLTHRRFSTRTWVTVGGLLATAAAFLLVVRIAQPSWWVRLSAPRPDRPELIELIAAVANEPTRPVEGRVTGGFKYAPPPSPARGPGDRDVSPDVRIAAARIEKVARAHDAPENEAALGVAYLALGDFDKAIELLESAVEQRPTDARYQTDLSAAYVARAKWRDRAQDWPKALTAAERAVKADPKLVEPHFNRALALEGLHLDAQAAEAWSSYQSLDPSSEWSREAAERARSLKQRLNPGGAAKGNQDLREQIEDELLTRWGEAVLAGNVSLAEQVLEDAASAAQELAESGGDSMARDEIALIRKVSEARHASTLGTLANAHVLYGRAREQFLSDHLQRASELMSEASVQFGRVASAYAHWGPIYRAMVLWISGSGEQALTELLAVPLQALPEAYFHLRGRYEWTQAMGMEMLGRFDLARQKLELAVDAFRRGEEIENLSANETGLAEAEWFLGERAKTWGHEINALTHLNVLRASMRRNGILFEGSFFSLGEELPETALHFQNALVRSIELAGQQTGRPDAYMRRARIFARLGDPKVALDDLILAERATSEVDDEGFRARSAAELARVRAELLQSTNPSQALDAAKTAIEFFRRAGPPHRLPELFVRRGRTLEVLRDMHGAHKDLRSAVDAFEQDRARLLSPQDRMRAFEQQREAFRELVRFEATVRGNQTEALRIAERGRARGLLENLAGDRSTPLDPAVAHRQLPDDVAVVYYATLTDRVLVWVLTKTACVQFTRVLGANDLSAAVHRIHRLIGQDADLTKVAPYAAHIFNQLVEPALGLAGPKTRIVFVPDGPLSTLPFGVIPDRQGQPLIAARTVGIAPSLTAFMTASRRLSGFSADDVLAVGDGHDPGMSGLPRLALANEEALDIGRLYPEATVLVGTEATKRRFLAANRAVIHFAGHTIVNPDFPLFSRILLARDADDGDDGTWLAADIARRRFDRTRVVVLGTCDGAAGRRVEGEGVMSVARTFLDAGVPSVVASLWPVDDRAHTLLTTLHRELRNQRDPATALRTSQLLMLNQRGFNLPIRVWGGFVALGGATSLRLHRKEATDG